jgi:2Fe-2S ferredoxin
MSDIRVRFIVQSSGAAIDVPADSASPISDHDGEPGSLLQIALSGNVPIEHACGGVGVCATCHVLVEQGAELLSPADEAEEDTLDQAAGLTRTSRLACRAVVTKPGDLVVRIPAWNRND